MKKKIVIIVYILFGVTISNAQIQYMISVHGNAHHSKNAHCAELGVEVTLSDGDVREVHRQSYNTAPFRIDFDKQISVPDNVTIHKIRLWASRRERSSCSGPRPNSSIDFPLQNPYTCFYSESTDHGDNLFGNALWFADITINAEPLVDVLSPGINDFLPMDRKVEVKATPGFPENFSVYTWQYSIDNAVNFHDVPMAHSGKPIMNISARDILGAAVESYLGKQIQFRMSSCNDRRYSVPPRTYTIVPSAPTFSAKEEFLTSCYSSVDGSVRFTFSRELFSGEKLVILPEVGSTSFPSTGDITELQVNPISGKRDTYTLENLPPGTYRATVLGFYGTYNTYSEDADHSMNFTIGQPSVVEIESVVGVNSRCDDGDSNPDNNNDGEILITAKGGNPGKFQYSYRLDGGAFSAWIDFNNGLQHRMIDVKPGDYDIKVKKVLRDYPVECVAYELNSSNEPTSVVKLVSVSITEPEDPIGIAYTLLNEPSAFGFEDGRIMARIFGGSKFVDGSYRFEWKNEAGQVLNSVFTEVLSGDQGYQLTLHSIGAGTYYLNVWDAKYDEATYKTGCFQINSEYTLEQPEPIQVTIDIHLPISCHIENEYNDGVDFNSPLGIPDQFQDGALIATVTGGVPFENTIAGADECRANFKPYCYNWKKLVGGIWVDIPTNDNIIYHQSVGTYALNVEDKNGIVLGTYEEFISPDGSREYRLVEATDETKYLPQPDKLEIAFTNTVVTCLNGDDAEATVMVTGGTPPYSYEWSNGQNTPTVNNLIGGTYLVFVTDAKGCRIEGSVKIEQPNGLEITPISVVDPTCFEGNDGQIEVEITGGNPPYTYTWDIGNTTTSVNGLFAGTYRIEVEDNKGCKAFFEETLTNPDPIVVAMEQERSLCNGQSLQLDIAIPDPGAVYSWSGDNGFVSSDSAVEITNAGRYTATITSSLGCIGIGEIEVKVFDTPIDADFLITTQAYDDQEVILVNVSDPMGETIEWTIPEGVEVISESEEKLVLKFDGAGPYDINLRSNQGDCYQDFTKTVLVQPAIEAPEVFASQGEFIEEFIVYPNPNGGAFKTKITLAEHANISLKIINLMSGATMHERSEKNNQDFLLDYSLSLPTGVYLLLLETPKGTETRKLVFE
ncbi:T9SS type A sorting domain-containing protein [Aquimarina sediminis]|uniref:T9SS type A sorting domain-containing protein n=1 Tax=Aquimarina sediminis TaxID=2070536 RepID=UPI000CA021CE|nr:T9SS type A sorting domain-containing protein [Aquimarina sediminis]